MDAAVEEGLVTDRAAATPAVAVAMGLAGGPAGRPALAGREETTRPRRACGGSS